MVRRDRGARAALPLSSPATAMTAPIAGFICALVLAVVVIAWIAYCMFVRERHKNMVHYDISDLRKVNYEVAQEQAPEKKEVSAGIFILPSRRKQKDDYEHRPDYPESPPPNLQPGTDKLVEMLVNDPDYKDGIFEIESKSQYHSDV